jgi:broad specificity phosphatase PhoE
MELLLVRHGESVGNLEGRMQGHQDRGLTEQGSEQARRLGDWFRDQGIVWDAAYCSPLGRARETARIVTARCGLPEALPKPDLMEIGAGSLEGLTRDEMAERHPSFLNRGVEHLGDFAEFGGESYDQVQQRVERLLDELIERHRAAEERALLVGHGGINFQLLKRLICRPVPRVCIVRMGNCSATLVQLAERRGTYLGEIVWHLPLELMGSSSRDATSALFR